MVVIVDHDNHIIKEIIAGNSSSEQIKLIDNILRKGHEFELLTISGKILLVIFAIFPESLTETIPQNQIVSLNPNNKKSINDDILKQVFDSITINKYIQLSTMKIQILNLLPPFKGCHAGLIFKTSDDYGKTYYNFFNANFGFFKSEHIKDIAKVINVTTLNNKFLKDYILVGFTELKKLLLRDSEIREIISQFA